MPIIGINWNLADKIYAREEDKIREEMQEKQQEVAKIWSQANRFHSGARISSMHKIHIETLSSLTDASIDSDWDIVIRSGPNIPESVIDNIIARLNSRLTRYINNFIFSVEQSIRRESISTLTLSSLQKKSNEAKTKLIVKAKRELEIRGGLLMIEDLKKKRFQFLQKLYDMTERNESAAIPIENICQELDFGRDFALKIANYLMEEGLLKFMTFGPTIGITHYGVREVEKALSEPDKPTEHFPPINIISVGQMVGSQIQQSSPGSTQAITISEDKLKELKEIIQSLEGSMDEFRLGDQQKSEIQADIQTIETQISSSKPKGGIIKESLHSIRNILEGATGSAITSVLLPRIIAVLDSLA